ncbi:MAG TPA: hypothetical protein VH137_05595 [Gemmatimonadales bacterium]|nr:hypothetical protein [Gemmatimonadales bacterium]
MPPPPPSSRSVSRTNRETRWRAVPLTGALLAVGLGAPLCAQLSVQLAGGVRATSTLVHDSIVTRVDVRPALEPSLAVAATVPLEARWSAEALLDVSWGSLERHDRGGPTVDLGRLGTVALEVGVRRPLFAGLSARIAVGALKYVPSGGTDLFRGSSGGVFPLGALALGYVPPLAFAQRWGLGVDVRYDVHAFITPALRAQGFTTARPVHRIALALGARWPRAAARTP